MTSARWWIFRALARAVRPFAQVSALVEQGVLLETAGHRGTDGTAGDWAGRRGFGEPHRRP